MIAKFDANYGTRQTDPARQQFEAPLWPTAYLDYSPSLSDSNLIKEPDRFLCEFPGLLLQTSLLHRAVAEKVFMVVCHCDLPSFRAELACGSKACSRRCGWQFTLSSRASASKAARSTSPCAAARCYTVPSCRGGIGTLVGFIRFCGPNGHRHWWCSRNWQGHRDTVRSIRCSNLDLGC